MRKKKIQYCPSCDSEILSDNINISEGFALCGNCGELSQLSQLNFTGTTREELLRNPPKGCSIISDKYSAEITVSLFSFPSFIMSLFITLFWNGIVSVFLSLAAAAVYYNLFGPVPDWFPTPGLKEGQPIMNDEVMGVGMTIFFCLFLTPFVIIGVCMISNTLLRLFGTTKIILTKHYSFVSTGISLFRFRRSFNACDVKSINYKLSKLNQDSEQNQIIEIVTSTKETKFGLLLNEGQQDWVTTILKLLLIQKDRSRHQSQIPKLSWLVNK